MRDWPGDPLRPPSRSVSYGLGVKIVIVGAGPAGLYLAYLLRRQRRDAEITLVEQNSPGTTVGFGLVFSERALDFLYQDDPETHALIVPAMETWRDLTVVHRGERVRIDGIGFAGIGRLKMLELLQRRLVSEGVTPRFRTAIQGAADLRGYDLVVGADGVNSVVRHAFADGFGTSIRTLRNKFAWYGTRRRFATLTQTFITTEFGPANAHHYSYAPDMSTFLVECAPETWERTRGLRRDGRDALPLAVRAPLRRCCAFYLLRPPCRRRLWAGLIGEQGSCPWSSTPTWLVRTGGCGSEWPSWASRPRLQGDTPATAIAHMGRWASLSTMT
jgi:2-polyprenyl-6-methoxyphenol hydroxylase-like FAD-dependent oxidoreductase